MSYRTRRVGTARSSGSINGRFYEDSAESVVMYFLANASTFRGNDAKVLKLELKNLLKGA